MVPAKDISEDDQDHDDKPDLSAPATVTLDDELGEGVWRKRELLTGEQHGGAGPGQLIRIRDYLHVCQCIESQ